LVKKSYGDKRKRHKLRNWQLQQLDREMEATNQESYDRDYTEFLEELEEDKLFRQNVNIYFSESLSSSSPSLSMCVCYGDDTCFTCSPIDPKAQAPPSQDPDVAADVPRIGIEEMLQDLSITDDNGESGHNARTVTDSSGDVIMGTD
jgi:hypothetical protein